MSRYDYDAVGTRYKYYLDTASGRIYEFEQGKDFAQKYIFFMIRHIQNFNHAQLDRLLEFHFRENFESDITDFEHFMILVIRQARNSYWKDDVNNTGKIETIYEWINDKKMIIQNSKRKQDGAGYHLSSAAKIECLRDHGSLLKILTELNKNYNTGRDKLILDIEGSIQDFVFENFIFPKYNFKVQNAYTVKWNEECSLLISLMWYLNNRGYFKQNQKKKIKSFLRKEFGEQGFTDSNFDRYWYREDARELAIARMEKLIGISLKYYL
ncbi:MAG TPA: hypothetical protein PK711_07445 [Bacteroidales bacterium]|nr:hypothetical protein [Bacteroidales bacterium]